MNSSENIFLQYHERVISEWKAIIGTFPGITSFEINYSERDQMISGLLEINGKSYSVKYFEHTLEDLLNEINIDFARMAYNSLPKEQKQTKLCITIRENRYPKYICLNVHADEKPQDLYFFNVLPKKIYDFATGTLNIGKIERMYDLAVVQTTLKIIDYAKDEPIVEDNPTEKRPENLMKMPMMKISE